MVDFNGLKENLAAQMRLLEELLKLEEQTMAILLQGNAASLEETRRRKEEIVEKIRAGEEERRRLLPLGLTLRELCRRETPPSPEKEELETLRLRLLQLLASLQRLVKVNRHFLKHNLQFVDYALKILLPHQEAPLYASSGQLKGQGASFPGLLDSSA